MIVAFLNFLYKLIDIQPLHRERSANQPLLKHLPCQAGEFEVCQIKPSTMYFTQTKMSSLEAAGHDRLVSVSQGGSNYRVCYSNHASLAELRQLVRHLQPRQITPCAIPAHSSRAEVRDLLASFLDQGDTKGARGAQDTAAG